MRLVIQKVSQSNVKVDGKIVGEIGKGYMVLVGITEGDDEKIVDKMVDKLVNLRIFIVNRYWRKYFINITIYVICKL